MSQYAFYFDSTKCTGCKTCQVVCKENHKLAVDNLWRRVYQYEGGSWTYDEATEWYQAQDVFGYHISVACNHCTAPACVANCPTSAIEKDGETGIVTINAEACIGCKTCTTACPYSAPTFVEETGVVSKCDMCSSRLAEDKRPLCVSACPMRALDFGPAEELIARYGEGDVEIAPLPQNTTAPNLILNPHPKAQKSGSEVGGVANLPEEL